ncbi:hypothetical protein F542_17950 [Bibersteinia trehalosi USDA-ARS-USMARC-188]|uniref:Uncharacterized protein n=3 Tax=Bibersteinia trehalosi TaxID=47735 RepID=W0R4I2_BIBTR|nr:hypothetical protein [Bibersteinia trehalosi]AGH37681.1 hypothetical protein WQG_4010 [Bibersteinia trehalosi USDA-ARS-USMARC-192]AHG82510.1 hypothetical protein F542_17950 [Bibersteinia trehalosi USDA-ARS-USMARC-188]AHG84844.1 hypothetical protein F543_19830 [Bibersteinia trehalosi USDA-ARS-USMARC-189]AHG85671.1 hypothetical protein F544_4390 [Bibersteinia trehalosi USDA-ARS-USMARC-190]
MTSKEELLRKQQELDILFTAWFEEKKKHEVLTYRRENGDLIQHYPDGTEKVIKYAQ